MKYTLLIILFTCIQTLQSQSDTEVFVFDFNVKSMTLSNKKNISNNEGYDNQPIFINNSTLLYSGSRNNQTDIIKYDLLNDTKEYICQTEGSEYSPLVIPNTTNISAVRLETTGKQTLNRYAYDNRESPVLVEDVVNGYYTWINENEIVASVLKADQMDLYFINLDTDKYIKLDDNVGRSIHRIAGSKLISYISKKTMRWTINAVDPYTYTVSPLASTLNKTEDICWLDNSTIILAYNQKLFTLDLNIKKVWEPFADLKALGVLKASRISISPDKTKLAIVGEPKNY